MSVEESYSKQTSSVSSSMMSSSTMESTMEKSSSLMSSAIGDLDLGMSSLVSKIDSDLAIMDSGKDLMAGEFICNTLNNFLFVLSCEKFATEHFNVPKLLWF